MISPHNQVKSLLMLLTLHNIHNVYVVFIECNAMTLCWNLHIDSEWVFPQCSDMTGMTYSL